MNSKELTFIVLFILAMLACKDEITGEMEIDPVDETEMETVAIETPDWTEATHSNDVSPNYSVVFPENEVLQIYLTISDENWSAMQADLDANLGGSFGGPGGGPGGVGETDFTPLWVSCTLEYNGKEWYQVGIRYKGNSTLRNAYQGDSDKYPFKLDFDEFEDTYPDIKNQRFYGFKQLNLGNNYSDGSFMREKVAADLFREFGVPAARTTFAAVYLDRGNGSNFIGMYTLVEEVDDSVLASQFPDDNGNLYKPEGIGATFADGTFNEADMDKKTNEDEADYSDVLSLYEMLNNDTRTTNENQWTSNLESIFNVDRYLQYLAANTVIQNWDTYGRMTHNYFLYNDEGKLVWIPWDNNESMQNGKMGGALSLALSEVGEDWPLIRYVMDVKAYEEQYKVYLSEFTTQVFEVNKMETLYASYEALIGTYAAQESSRFSSEVANLKAHVTNRNIAVDNFLE